MNIEKNPLVSVCVPTYNTGKYIEKTLRSIMNQTYQNIEIIVGDNASTDDTENRVKDLMKKDQRIVYYQNKTNIGGIANFNKLVAHARSEFVTIYHSDDLYEPSMIEKELFVLANNKNIAGVFSKLRRFSDTAKELPKVDYSFLKNLTKKENFFFGNLETIFPLLLNHNSFLPCPSFMGKKSIYQKLGGFREKYKQATDLDFWLTLLKAGYDLAMIDDTLLNYRIHDDQDSFKYRSPDRENIQLYFQLMDDFMNENHLKIDKKRLKIYHAQKSMDLLEIAYNYSRKKNKIKMLEWISLSRKVYLFPFFFYEGMVQRFPALVQKDKFWVKPFYYGGILIKKIISIFFKLILKK